MMSKSANSIRLNSWPSRGGVSSIDNTPSIRGRFVSATRGPLADSLSTGSSKTVLPTSSNRENKSESSSPQKENIRAGSISPIPSRKEVNLSTPKSST